MHSSVHRSWETSDAFSYKEIGAEKSGRDSTGRVWREAHAEHFDMDAAGVRRIWRSADKWAKATDGSQWHEKWNEEYGMDGYTERDAYKYGSLAPGVIPEDGHAARWCETWGEKWDGKARAPPGRSLRSRPLRRHWLLLLLRPAVFLSCWLFCRVFSRAVSPPLLASVAFLVHIHP